MRYLYIDTSSSYLYASIVNNDKVESQIKKDFGTSLSEVALPQIVKMFNENNLKPKDIDKIIVVNGPGSFTGIRIGITIAKVYAWSLNIPITTITSLEAMSISSNKQNYKVPLIDARRNYYYAAIYDKDNKEVMPPKYIKQEVLDKKLELLDNFTIITNDNISQYNNIEKYTPNFINIINFYKDKKSINPHAVNPNYLKLTKAEESQLD